MAMYVLMSLFNTGTDIWPGVNNRAESYMDRAASLVDTYFRANIYTTQLQEEITCLKELEGKLTASRDVAVRECQEQN